MKSSIAVASWILLAVSCGCSDKKGAAGAAASAPPTASETPPVAKEAPKPAPADVVLEPVLKALKCDKKSKTDSCRLLTEFSEAARFVPQTPAGEGRWIGNAFVREKGLENKQLILLWAKEVPTSHV